MGLEKSKRERDYLMSDFKIVCGTNPKDKTIINLDKVKEIVLDDEYIENSMCVTIYGTDGDTWHFETNLKRIEQVIYCLYRPDSEHNVEFSRSVWRLGNEYDYEE